MNTAGSMNAQDSELIACMCECASGTSTAVSGEASAAGETVCVGHQLRGQWP